MMVHCNCCHIPFANGTTHHEHDDHAIDCTSSGANGNQAVHVGGATKQSLETHDKVVAVDVPHGDTQK